MNGVMLWTLLLLGVANATLMVVVLIRTTAGGRSEAGLREEMRAGREEASRAARESREELSTALRSANETLSANLGGLGEVQRAQLDGVQRRERCAVVEQCVGPQHEIVAETVRRHRHRFGEAWFQRLSGHRLLQCDQIRGRRPVRSHGERIGAVGRKSPDRRARSIRD